MSLRMLWKIGKEPDTWWVLDLIYNRKLAVRAWHKVWWKYMPGTVIKVKWPVGWTRPDHLGNQTESTDPNEHYRPWLIKNVGRQGLDWQWDLRDNDIIENTLTIKFRKGKERWATVAAINWN